MDSTRAEDIPSPSMDVSIQTESLTGDSPAAAAPDILSIETHEAQTHADPLSPTLCHAVCWPSDLGSILWRDARQFPRSLVGDAWSLLSWRFAGEIGLGALAAGLGTLADDDIRSWTADHPRRWGQAFNETFDVLGHPGTDAGVVALLYATSMFIEDEKLHDWSLATANSLILTMTTVSGLKLAFDTTRPNGEAYGFPSGHTASSFVLAATTHEYYGFWAAAPVYTLAGLVAWHRVDDRAHDLSDVLFGAALGMAIGHGVARHHLGPNSHWTLYSEPWTGTTGLGLFHRF